jgi:hypothetical protein
MAENDFYAELAKLTGTAIGQIRLAHFQPIFCQVAASYLDEATRPVAEVMMKDWAGGDDPLAKGMAQHWLDRAHAVVQGGMEAGKAVDARKVHPLIARILASKKQKPGLRKAARSGAVCPHCGASLHGVPKQSGFSTPKRGPGAVPFKNI